MIDQALTLYQIPVILALDVINCADNIKELYILFPSHLNNVTLNLFELWLLKTVSFGQQRDHVGVRLELFDSKEILLFGVMSIEEEQNQVDPPVNYLLLSTGLSLVLALVPLLNLFSVLEISRHA